MNKLELKLKKLCTYYSNWFCEIFYDFKIDKINNKLIFYYWGDVSFNKELIIDWIDDLSYDIWKTWIKKQEYHLWFYHKENQKKYFKMGKKLDDFKKIKNFEIIVK